MIVVSAIKEGHWDSIEEMNKVGNVARMHVNFTALFLYLVLIFKRYLPEFSYLIFTRASEESKAKIETGEKTDIENPPQTYSEVLEITVENPSPNYSEVAQIIIKYIENERERQKMSEDTPQITIENPPPNYSESNPSNN